MSLSLTEKPASPPLQTVPSPKKATTFPEKVWGMLACFRSIHLAIVLLSLLAMATLAGVLLPQDGLVDVAQIKKTFGPNFRMFKAMGLFNVYSSYWFIALEVLFFFNLLCGSFKWLKPAYLAATRKVFCAPEHIRASKHRLEFDSAYTPDETARHVSKLLKKYRYGVYQTESSTPGNVLLYARKGNFSRLGPAVAHFGILLMLVASVAGAFTGFKAQKLAVPGETFRIQDSQMFKPNVDADIWLGSVPPWKIRVNDFRIDYYADGEAPVQDAKQSASLNATAKQYYADLSVIDKNGQETKREVISVNHPMTVGDTVIYQASFNPTGKLFVTINGKLQKLDANAQFMNRAVSMTDIGNGKTLMVFPFMVQQDPNVTRNYVVMFLRDAHGFVGARPGKMPPNLRLLEGQSGQLGGMSFRFIRPEIATGLQIKKGPEVPWMYLAYLIIIAGTIMCIFSQRRIWVAVRPSGNGASVQLLYKTNKARLSFMKELQRFQTELNAGLNPAGKAQTQVSTQQAESSV